MARRSKLTRTLLDTMEPLVETAWSIDDVCAELRISQTTWHQWRVDAENGSGGLKAEFAELAARVGTGRRSLAMGTLRKILNGDDATARASDRVTAALGILRLDHTARAQLELSGPDGGPISVGPPIDLSKLTRDELLQLRAIMEKAETGDTQ